MTWIEVTAQETEALGSSFTSTDVDSTRDAKMVINDLKETINNTLMEAGGVEDEQKIHPVSSVQESMEFSSFEQILNVVVYAIESYFTSATIGDWLAGLGEVARHSEAHGEARFLKWLKFSPIVNQYVEALRPLGFAPYPDPYVPMYLAKNDIWKVAINWISVFGLISLFCKYNIHKYLTKTRLTLWNIIFTACNYLIFRDMLIILLSPHSHVAASLARRRLICINLRVFFHRAILSSSPGFRVREVWFP